MLDDFSFTPPEQIYAGLRKAGMRTLVRPPWRWAAGPDLNDVNYDAFLANDRKLADPEVVQVDRRRVLLRVINGSSMSNFHLGALSGELIAVDGFRVQPVTARAFPSPWRSGWTSGSQFPAVRQPTQCLPFWRAAEADRHRAGGRRRTVRASRYCRDAISGPVSGSGAGLRAVAPLRRRKVDRVHTQPDRQHGELRLVDQRCRLGPRTCRRFRSPRASGWNSSSRTRPRCRIRCTCTATNSRWSKSTASDLQARCVTRSW